MHRVALVAVLAACAEKPDHVIELGILEFYGHEVMIDVPSTAVVGESFVVGILSYGGGCISAGETTVDSDADGADVFPFDRRAVGDFACTADLRFNPHDVTLIFDTPGRKKVRVQGRRVTQDADENIVFGFPVVVTE